jgi:hypothetical protein
MALCPKITPMKITTYPQQPDFTGNAVSKNLATRIIHSAAVLLAFITLAIAAMIVVYWSLNNGTFTKFTI